jgi:hypothetical protein
MANEFARRRQDADVNAAAKALPAAASTAVNTASINLKSGAFLSDVEFEIQAPDLNTTELPDTRTLTYSVYESSDDSTFTLLYDSVLVQTGAGGAGASAENQRFRVPAEVLQYIRVTATTGASTGDCSGSTVSLVALF